jgi:hypothetical protein
VAIGTTDPVGSIGVVGTNDNGLAADFASTAAATSAIDPMTVRVRSGLNSATALSIVNTSAGGLRWDLRSSGHTDPLTGPGYFYLYDPAANRIPIVVGSGATNLSVFVTSTGVGFGITPKFAFHTSAAAVGLGAPAAAPNDANLNNSNLSFYLNEGSNQLKVRVRYSNGTLKTGSVTLN